MGLRSWMVVLTLVLVGGSARGAGLEVPSARLRGVIYVRGSRTWLPDATVSLRPEHAAAESSPAATTRSAADGSFALAVRAGVLRLHVTHPGFAAIDQPLILHPGQEQTLNLYLRSRSEGAHPFEARVSAPAREERTAQRFTLQGESLRTLPGTLGDPLRVLGLLPGVASPVPGIPVFAVRGAGPGLSGFYLDGIQLPQLFHLLVGGGVVHPGIVERIDLYASGYDVTLGRQAGGVAVVETRGARGDGQHLELELRLLDVSGLLELKLPHEVRLSLSGHYGYPGLLLHAIDDRVRLSYWDYQVRLDWRSWTLQALGGFDELVVERDGLGGQLSGLPNARLMFHRLQLRHRSQRGPLRVDAAIVGSYDEATDALNNGVKKLAASARISLRLHLRRVSLQLLLDGGISRFQISDDFNALSFLDGAPQMNAAEPEQKPPGGGSFQTLGELVENRVGAVGGAALQAVVELVPGRLTLTAGARLDAYHAGEVTLLGLDPRAQLHAQLTDWLALRVSGGYYQQPPSFPVQLPGIDTFALRLGLQHAIHALVTQELRLPAQLTLLVSGYRQQFYNVTELPDFGHLACALPQSPRLTAATAVLLRATDGTASGLEVLLRRQHGHITGWLAYTLSRSERDYPCGPRPADYDQSHILNFAAQAQLPRGWRVGVHVMVSTGRPVTRLRLPDWRDTPYNNDRLATFGQLDVRLDKVWRLKRATLTLFIEAINCTFSSTDLALVYKVSDNASGGYDYSQPQVLGFRWILPSLGLRGNF